MTRGHSDWVDDDRALGDLLAAVGERLDVPEVDLVPGVRSVLESDEHRPAGTFWIRAAAAILLAGVAVTLIVAPARRAVADWLGIGSTSIEYVEELPEPDADAAPPPDDDLTRAAGLVGFEPLVPDPERHGRATGWTADETGAAEWLIGVWPDFELVQRRATSEEPITTKLLDPRTTITEVTVRGRRGLWINGPHARAERGAVVASTNALLWVEEGLDLRIESDLDLSGALEVAESLEST